MRNVCVFVLCVYELEACSIERNLMIMDDEREKSVYVCVG